MELNAESVLDALNDFERKPIEIPPILEDYLLRVAQNGEIIFPWCKLKPLLKRKLEVVLDEFYESCPVEISVPVPNFETFNYDLLKKSILQAVDTFTSAPFTIQRICELVTNPKKHYNRTDKYMRGIEKNVLVVSTIEPRIGVQNDANANVNPVVNGMIDESPRDDNDCFNGHENTENESTTNVNIPACHVLLENFANVFPSAACIPSPSNICINREITSMDREIDTNFIPSSECVETQEVEFSPQVPMLSAEADESKEEQMDTTVEEHESESERGPTDENCEVTTAETEQTTESKDTNKPVIEEEEEGDSKIDNTVDNDGSETTSSMEENVSASENVKHEADCSESSSDSDAAVTEKEPTDSNQCQQDDTISQSDDQSHEANEVSQSDVACDTCEALPNEETLDTPSETAPEVSQSVENSDLSGQCMDLESSTEEPSV